MMKRLVFFGLVICAAPAFAFAADAPPAPGQRAAELLLERERAQHQNDLGAALQFQDRIADLTKQVADLTKERDELKSAKAAPVVPALAPTTPAGPTGQMTPTAASSGG